MGSTWLALIGGQSGAFKLAARDRRIGWSAEQQFRRLYLIANNVRFVILTPRPVPNLASRMLGLSLRRLPPDMQALHGYPILLAETFVDPARFAGTQPGETPAHLHGQPRGEPMSAPRLRSLFECLGYRASNWRSLGLTRGYAREPGGAASWRPSIRSWARPPPDPVAAAT